MNKIIIELSAEDRARLDRIAELLEANANASNKIIRKPVEVKAPEIAPEKAQAAAPVITPVKEEKPAEAPKIAPETAGTAAPQVMPKTEEKAKPAVTLAQIQQKVVQLAAGFNGAKKAAVREIVKAYAEKVSAIPEDKWDEVWAKLTALEAEA